MDLTTHLVLNQAFLADNQRAARNLSVALVEVTRRISPDKAAAIPILNDYESNQSPNPSAPSIFRPMVARL